MAGTIYTIYCSTIYCANLASKREQQTDPEHLRMDDQSTQIRLRAAQYLRMSTEHQQYSTQNQQVKIQEYADQRGIEIVRTYADEGKSGLSIGGRSSLKKLIADVENAENDFGIILVFDVSRWGRFQDADESAYYEYICRRSGIQVIYCGEQFENDGSPVSTIVKGVKRAMAGEYSRELSTKVFTGQCRLIELGYRQGGAPGYGLRRVLIDQQGQQKSPLAAGEHKSIQTDRVVLVPGPPEEVHVVNLMYRWLIEDDLGFTDIAGRLNGMGVRLGSGGRWSYTTVRQVLTSEKYIGNNVFNKTSFKLNKQRVKNPPEMWIRKESAFEAIVPAEVFYTAQSIIAARAERVSDEELLEKLRETFQEKRTLSGLLIDQSKDLPTIATFRSRFGTLTRAYEMVGYRPQRDERYQEENRRLRKLHPEIIQRTQERIIELGAEVTKEPKANLLRVNNEIVISIVIARCKTLADGRNRWKFRFDNHDDPPDITVAIRLDQSNMRELDYYLLPRPVLEKKEMTLSERGVQNMECFRYDDLTFLYALSQRCTVKRNVQ